MTSNKSDANGAGQNVDHRANNGYSPFEKRGYAGAQTGQKLPKAPPGGTGQTALVSNGSDVGAPKKQQG